MANAYSVDESTYNAEGFLRYTRATEGSGGGFGFQIFHNGMYECVAAGTLWQNGLLLRESDLGRQIARSWQHMNLLDAHLGASPWLVSIAVWNLANAQLGLPENRVAKSAAGSDDPIFCNEVRIDELPATAAGFAVEVAPSLQPFYTAFKLPGVMPPLNADRWAKILKE